MCSQQPTTSPHSEPHESSPHHPTIFPVIHTSSLWNVCRTWCLVKHKRQLYLYFTIHTLVSQVISLLQDFQSKFCTYFSIFHICYMTCSSHPPPFDILNYRWGTCNNVRCTSSLFPQNSHYCKLKNLVFMHQSFFLEG
jgi:hypothetical protein